MSPAICFNRIWSVFNSKIKHLQFLWHFHHPSTLLHWKSLFWAPSWDGILFLVSVSSAFKQPTVLGITNICWEWLGTGWSDVRVSTHLTLRTILRCVLTENEGVNAQSWVQVSIVSCLVVHRSIFPTASPHPVLVGHLWTQSWVSDSGGKMRSVLPALLGLRLLVRADVYTFEDMHAVPCLSQG